MQIINNIGKAYKYVLCMRLAESFCAKPKIKMADIVTKDSPNNFKLFNPVLCGFILFCL